MLSSIRTHLARVRLRLWPLLVLLFLAAVQVLETLGAINLHPLLDPLLGPDKAGAVITGLAVLLAFMRPVVYMVRQADPVEPTEHGEHPA